MKTSLSVLLTFAAALAALPGLSAAPAKSVAGVLGVRSVFAQNGEMIGRGTTAYTVRANLGSPQATLSDDVWVYNNFRPVEKFAEPFGCTKLVITFAHNKVVDIHLATPRAKEVFAARMERSATPITLAEIATPALATPALALPR